jgi:hypothetical protein
VAKARPETEIPFTVTKIRPVSESKESTTYFVIEGEVENTEGWLRPGMEGAASIEIGPRRCGWVLIRRLWNWLRFKIWFF